MVDLLDLDSYDYYLPQELIAQYPLKDRSSSRLMHIDRKTGTIYHLYFRDLVDLLNPGEVLVINNSKVIPARLYGYKDNGTKIEVLLLNHLEGSKWKCMVHPGKRLKREQVLWFSSQLEGWISLPDEDGLRVIEFNNPDTYWKEIECIGHTPLPPYIKRVDEAEDRQTYQTVYAKEPGSVAAPTAGFHFTEEMLSQLQEKGIQIVNIILHIGMGTFVPIKTPRIDQHKMHSEFCTILEETANVINKAKLEGRRVIAVGSTSIRTLESFWENGSLMSGSKWTDIFIYPGKKIQVADALITNFHLPKSTLLMMISAFAGYELTRKAYEIAVQERYRFFSYGDAMYIS